jgi:TRAP-type C4-dicarboxylate transport system substrate-binding protein
MMSRNATAVLAAALAGATLFAALPASAETKVLFNRFVPPKHPFNTGMFIPWANDVGKATEGRVKVEFSAGSLAPPPKQWNMVSKGIAAAAMLANIFERNRLKLVSLAQLPFTAEKAETRGVALWRTHQKYLAKANEYKGMKLLGQWTISGAAIHHTKKPIRSLADLKNEKMWVIAGIPNKMFTKLGAVVVSVPGVKMFNVVSKGIVNGTVTSNYTMLAFKYMRYTKHITRFPGGINANTFSFLFSEKKWKRLSQKDKDAIWSVSAERIAVNAGRMVDKLDAKVRKIAKSKGVEIVNASPEFVAAMKAKLAYVTTDWLKAAASRGVDGPAALAYYKSQLK